MLTNHTSYKYETLYKENFGVTQCFNNGAVMLQYGATETMYNIRRIKPYRLDTKVEDFNSINIFDRGRDSHHPRKED